MVSTVEGKSFWRVKGFTRFICLRMAMSMAYQIYGVAVGWRVYELTHSAVLLGFVGLTQFLPMLVAALPAGLLADQVPRRLLMAGSEAGSAAGMLALAAATFWGSHQVGLIFGTVCVVGGLRTLDTAATTSLLPNLVPNDQLPRAVAASSTASQFAVVVGPALGGFLYVGGAAVPFAASGLLYAAAAVFSFGLPVGRLANVAAGGLKELFVGVKFIWAEKVVLGAISLDLFGVLLGGATALLPVYAHDILHIGPVGLGVLRSAPAVGAVLAAAWFTRVPLQRRVGIKMLLAVIGFGAATVVFGVSRSMPLSLAALAMLGACDVVSVLVRTAMVQLRTPDAMRGRVASVNGLFIGTSNQLGEFESGMVAGLLGPVGSVVTGGIGTILIALAWMGIFPGLRTADKLQGD